MLSLQVNIALAALRVALSQEYLCVDHGLAASRTWESEASLRGERALALFKEQNRLLLRELQRRLTAQVRSATSAEMQASLRPCAPLLQAAADKVGKKRSRKQAQAGQRKKHKGARGVELA